MELRSGGRILVDQLLVHGADRAFCVPGESFLAVLDALHDVRERLPLVVCRHEAGAGNMAEADGKLTGRPGICFVTRGPGAAHASIALHTAWQDSTPMLLFIGQVGSDFVEREAFQEIDYRRMFGQLAKWVASIDRADRIPELVARAFQVATSGRPGPVVLALPEDMLSSEVAVADARPYQPVQASPAGADIERMQRLLAAAERPLVLLGGPGWTDQAVEDLREFAERCDLPVACAFRYQDRFDNLHPNYVGDVGIGVNPALAARVRDADLLLVLGPRLGEMTTSGYTLIDVPVPRQTLVHVHPGPEELGRVYQADLPIASGMPQFAAALRGLAVDPARWRDWRAAARADYERWREPPAQPGPVQYARLMRGLGERLPEDAIIANGAGNFAAPLHRFHAHRRLHTQLAPTSGAMGYGVPAAIAAKLRHPGRTVLALAGDGDFMMTGQELATARQYGANVVFVVVNNGMYGTIRMHQEREYPARVYGTALENPDFVRLAEAYGCHAERVETTEAFDGALERALAAQRPALIEIVLDAQALTANQSLDQIRQAALQRQGKAR